MQHADVLGAAMTTERDQTVSERNLPEPEVAVAAAPAADPSLLGRVSLDERA